MGSSGGAPYFLRAAGGGNYTFSGRTGYEFFIQSTDGSPISGYPPFVETCPTTIYAMGGDCTTAGVGGCAFGVDRSGGAGVKLLIGSSLNGGQVTAVAYHVPNVLA